MIIRIIRVIRPMGRAAMAGLLVLCAIGCCAAGQAPKTAKCTEVRTFADGSRTETTVYYKAPSRLRTESAGRLQIEDLGSYSVLNKRTGKSFTRAYGIGGVTSFNPEDMFTAAGVLRMWRRLGTSETSVKESNGTFDGKQVRVIDADISAAERNGKTIVGPQHLTIYVDPATGLILGSKRELRDIQTGSVLFTEAKTWEYGIDLPDNLFIFKAP